MNLSQRINYAIRMMVDLVCMSNDQRTTVGEVTQRQDVAKPFMAKIASKAAVAGLVVTHRGTGSGPTGRQYHDATNNRGYAFRDSTQTQKVLALV